MLWCVNIARLRAIKTPESGEFEIFAGHQSPLCIAILRLFLLAKIFQAIKKLLQNVIQMNMIQYSFATIKTDDISKLKFILQIFCKLLNLQLSWSEKKLELFCDIVTTVLPIFEIVHLVYFVTVLDFECLSVFCPSMLRAPSLPGVPPPSYFLPPRLLSPQTPDCPCPPSPLPQAPPTTRFP